MPVKEDGIVRNAIPNNGCNHNQSKWDKKEERWVEMIFTETPMLQNLLVFPVSLVNIDGPEDAGNTNIKRPQVQPVREKIFHEAGCQNCCNLKPPSFVSYNH